MNYSIGQKLKLLRKSKKLTQQDVADRLGVKRSTVSNYEIDRRKPSIQELERFAEFYGVGLDYFGIATSDDIFDIIARARNVFEDKCIPEDKKDKLHKELMRLYLSIGGKK